jgi:NodT family efflux transporter outer membrane factor (OMF) lipoprotein
MTHKDLPSLPLRLFLLVCLVLLSGCVNYAGIHSDAKPLNDSLLKSSYNTHTNTQIAIIKKTAWWTAFKDPQLNALVTTAIAGSPTLQVAQSRIRNAQQVAEASGANLWPSADAYAQIARERITRNGLFPPPYGGNSYTETNLGAAFNYEFDFFGKNAQALQASISSARAAEADFAEARLVLAAAVSTTYFQLQNNRAELAVESALLHHQQELLDIIKDRAGHGVDSDIPVSTAVADMETAKLAVAQLSGRVKISEHELAALLGQNPFTTHFAVAKYSYRQHYFAMPSVIPANLLGQRPDLIAARWRMESSAHAVNASKARFYPNINLSGFVSLQSYVLNKTFILPSRDMSIGPALDLPIFDAGRRRADLAQKYAEYDNAVGSYNETVLTGLREVADQATELTSIDSQQQAQQNVLTATERNYHLTRSRFQHGIVDYPQVLVIQNTLLKRQDEQIQLQTSHLKAMVALMKATGGNNLRAEG